MSTAVQPDAPVRTDAVRGRTRITGRALQRVAAAVAGDALGVRARQVDADLADHDGALDLSVHAPISVVPISRTRSEPQALPRSGGSILERCAAAEELVRDRVQDLTGYRIRRVTVRVSDVHVSREKRVR